jgi:hypothetical protein
MVEVPVREQQPVDFVTGKMGVGSLRSVEEQIACGRFEEVGVGVERAAREDFKMVHGCARSDSENAEI